MKHKIDVSNVKDSSSERGSTAILIKGRRAKSILKNMEGRPLRFLVKERTTRTLFVEHEIRIEALRDQTVMLTNEAKSALYGNPMRLLDVEVCACVHF
jgi:hypothetical protein